jgi:hypothetical protein
MNPAVCLIPPVGAGICAPAAAAVVEAVILVGGLIVINEISDDAGDEERELGDLEPIDAPGHNEPRPELEELTDEELTESVNEPKNGDGVKVRGNEVRDGNGRINEMKNRGFPDDTKIPVEELPPPEPMAPWETPQ